MPVFRLLKFNSQIKTSNPLRSITWIFQAHLNPYYWASLRLSAENHVKR